MSTQLICSALGLSPDDWPPDHYTLLGLPAGEAGAATVEERVLDRMERLRRYQLADPDAVTDAMNRLAQALVCLSDPAAKAAYDRALRPTPPSISPIVGDDEEPSRPYALAPPQRLTVAPVVPKPPVMRRHDDSRRRSYRGLAATRHLLAVWRDLGDYIADPASRPLRPTEGIEFVRTILELRSRLVDDAASVGLPGQAGAEVAALARQALPLTTFRHLTREERATLAADWQAAANRLAAKYSELSQRVRQHRRPALQRTLRKAAQALVTDRLDLALFMLGIVALGLAIWRSR